MKRLFFIAILLSAIACTKTPEYNITVNIEGAEGKVILEQRKAGEWITKDSAIINNGVAKLKGTVEFPEMYYLSVNGDRRKLIIFVENSNMTVSGKIDSIGVATVTGSGTHNEYNSVNFKIEEISNNYMTLYQESRKLRADGDSVKADQLMEKVNKLYESTGTIQEDFVKNNPASYATPYFLASIQYEKNEDELESLLKGLDAKLDSVSSIISLRERVEKMKTVSVGKIAPDFTQNDPEGNPVTFSDVYSKNKYTLVDFWAAWCGPCRQENPNVVAIYNDYKDKGFSVFGVSLDRTKEDWLKAIKDDGLTWQHVSDLSYWNNTAAQLYAVNSIPSNLLVDKDGKIIAKNLRGEDLRAKIAELLD